MRKKTAKKKQAPLPTQTTFRYTPEAAKNLEKIKSLTGENTNNKAINKVIQLYPEKVELIWKLEGQINRLTTEILKVTGLNEDFQKARKALEGYGFPKEIFAIIEEQSDRLDTQRELDY